jgi:hypothetical protein
VERNRADLVSNRDRQDRNPNPDAISRRIARLAWRGPATLAWPAATWAVNIIALAGAALLVWSAVIHLQLWADGYRDISVIGPLFLAQGVGSIVIAAALAALRRLALIVAGAVTLAATAVGLLLTVHVGLFGYRESLAVPYAQLSLVVEFTGAALLAALAVFVIAAPTRNSQPAASGGRQHPPG